MCITDIPTTAIQAVKRVCRWLVTFIRLVRQLGNMATLRLFVYCLNTARLCLYLRKTCIRMI